MAVITGIKAMPSTVSKTCAVFSARLHADVAGRRFAQRGGHERRRRHGGAGQDRAVGEKHPDVVAEAPVEDGEHQPQPGVELGRPQPGVQVAHVVLPDDGQGPGRLDVRVGEGLAAELGILQDPDSREPADLGAVVPLPGRQDNGHPLAVPGSQFFRDAVGQGPVTADDEVAATPGERWHAADHNGRPRSIMADTTAVDMIAAP
jgi:hypothetical protein